MRRHALPTIATVLLTALAPIGAGPARAEQTVAGPVEPRVETFAGKVDADRQVLGIPGMSAIVIEDGGIVWTAGLGMADVERGVAASPDTVFHLASVTKTFTAILVLQLAEQGRLDLDAPVSRWVPGSTDGRVRIRHLLSHTSEGTPGESFSYNPDRFEHLKVILEAVTGKPLRQLFVETFLDPLAMHDSVPGADVIEHVPDWAMLGAANLARWQQVVPRLARPYTLYGDGEVLPTSLPPGELWASAGLLSTVRDMAKYDAAIDAHALLSAQTLARAWAPFVSSAGTPLAMGLGWYASDYRGERLVWHFGHWGTGYSALYLKIPARRLTLVLLANSEALADHHYRVGEDVTHNVFACAFVDAFVPGVANGSAGFPPLSEAAYAAAAAKKPVPVAGPADDCALNSRLAVERWRADRRAKAKAIAPLDPALAAAVAGRYRFPGRIVTIVDEGGRLFVDFPLGVRSEIFASSPTDVFVKVRPWTWTVVREGGRVVRLDIVDGADVYAAERVE